MKNIVRVGRSLSPWGATFLVMGFVFCQAHGVQAQSNWSGILNRIPQAIGTHSRAPQNPKSTQDKTEMEGFVTIQSMSVGQIPKYITTNGGLADSVITESNGNIGIGTTSPSSPAGFSQLLHLRGSTNASFVADGGGLYRAEFGVSANGGWLSTADGIPFRFVTNNSERMRIDAAGNVGIGTMTP